MQAINPVQAGLGAFQQTKAIMDRPRQVKNEQRSLDQQDELNKQRLEINNMTLRNDKRGQLKQQAMQEWKLFDQGVKPFSRELHEQLLENGMENFTPYSLLENKGAALKFGPALAQISQGDMSAAQSPEALSALNEEFSTQIKRGVGQQHPITGQVVADKQIVGFQPIQGGNIVPVIRSVFENGESYDAPMTMNRSADPGDPVEAKNAGELMDDIMSRYQLAKLSQDPAYREKLTTAFNTVFEQQGGANLGALMEQLPDEQKQTFAAMAKADPTGKTAINFANSVLKPQRNLVTINNAEDKGLTEEQKALAKSRVKRFEQIQNVAQSALDQNEQLDQLETIDVSTGFGEDAKVQMARVFTAFGADGDGLLNVDVANAQAFNAKAGTLLAEALAAQKGPQTDRDAARIEATLPKLSNAQDSNRYIVASLKAINARKVEQAQFYEKILEGDGTLREADQKWREFKRKTPLASDSVVNRDTGLPMFFNEFMEKARDKNPSATDEQIIEAWRKVND